jgi:choline O-acetyltransferase
MDLSFRAYHLLTGGGTDLFTGNRWYDKFINFVVGRDGVCGLVIEHSGSEGITLIRFLHEFLDFIGEKGAGSMTSSGSNSGSSFTSSSIHRVDSSKRMVSSEVIQRLSERKVFHLKFVVDDDVSRGIHEASKRVDKLIDDLDLYVLQFKEFGKSFIKQQSMSPDAFIQIALQLTHYKVHRRLVSSYESAGLRQFKKGRVDSIRSCTMPVLFWAQAMCDEVPDVTVSLKHSTLLAHH